MAQLVACLLCTFTTAASFAQAPWVIDDNDHWVRSMLEAHPEDFALLLEEPEAWRVQVLVGEITTDSAGTPSVQIHPFRLDAEYEYPASALKTIGAVAALRTVQMLRALPGCEGLTVDTELMFHALPTTLVDSAGAPVVVAEDGRTTLRRELERTLIVSSNSAFNRLFDFAGHEALNTMMWDAGLESVRMRHRLSQQGLPEAAHRMAPEVSAELPTPEGAPVAQGLFEGLRRGWRPLLPARTSTIAMPTAGPQRQQVGTAYRAPLTRERVEEPLDFSDKNAVSLLDLLRIVAYVADPALSPTSLELDDAHRGLLREIMGRVPDDPDRYKPFSPGVTRQVPWDRLSYINKAGRAYGFHLDIAHIQDTESGRQVLVAAAIYANPNGVLNDDDYAYESVSYPFLTAIGAAVAERLLAPP